MEQIPELIETGVYSTFKVEKPITVGDLLKELNLEDKFFGLLIGGKKVDKSHIIKASDEVVILPNIAGGT